MMRVRPFIIAAGGVLAISACARPQPVHGQAYYIAHPNERSAAIADCRADPGDLEKTPNCINASAAAAAAESDHFWAIKKPKSRVANPGAL